MARWGESGFTFNTFAFCHHEVCARTLAQASAPMKLGIRPSAPGNRATLFFCSLVQTSFRNLSLLFILPRFSYILSCGSRSRRCKIPANAGIHRSLCDGRIARRGRSSSAGSRRGTPRGVRQSNRAGSIRLSLAGQGRAKRRGAWVNRCPAALHNAVTLCAR